MLAQLTAFFVIIFIYLTFLVLPSVFSNMHYAKHAVSLTFSPPKHINAKMFFNFVFANIFIQIFEQKNQN